MQKKTLEIWGKSRAMETHFYPIQICMFMKQTWHQCKNNALKQGLMVYMYGLFFSGSVKASWPKLRVDQIFAKITTLRHVIFAWPNLRVFFWTKSSRPSQNREVMSTRSLKSRIGGRREEMGVYSSAKLTKVFLLEKKIVETSSSRARTRISTEEMESWIPVAILNLYLL